TAAQRNPRRPDSLWRTGASARRARRDPDRRRRRHRLPGHCRWHPFGLAPRRGRRQRDRQAPARWGSRSRDGRIARRAPLPRQTRAALGLRPPAAGLAVRRTGRHAAAALGCATDLLSRTSRRCGMTALLVLVMLPVLAIGVVVAFVKAPRTMLALSA